MRTTISILLLCMSFACNGKEPLSPMQAFDFEYMIDGHITVRPSQVFDDGKRTYLQLPGSSREFVIISKDGGLLQATEEGNFIVVNGVHEQLVVRQGRLMARATKAVAPNPKAFGQFQLEEAEKEIASSIKKKNVAFDFEYEVLGNATEKPRLIYNDGAATWIEISELATVLDLDAKRSGPYWRINGTPTTIRLAIGPKKQIIEVLYKGEKDKSRERPVAPQVTNPVTGSFASSQQSNARPAVASRGFDIEKKDVARTPPVVGGAFVVEYEKKAPPKVVEPVKEQVAKAPTIDYDILEFKSPAIKPTPGLILRLSAFVEQHGLDARYQIGASSSERPVLEKQLTRLGVKRFAYSDEPFAKAKILMIKGDVE